MAFTKQAGAIIVICAALLIISGCATMRYPSGYKIEGRTYKEFKELDDERALKLVALIYNVRHEAWEDNIARSIALGEYLALLKKRHSDYIRKSGIFSVQYDKVKISTWREEDLKKLYHLLAPKIDTYMMEVEPAGLTETQNAERIVALTAVHAIARELKARQNTDTAKSVAAQVLMGALTIALGVL